MRRRLRPRQRDRTIAIVLLLLAFAVIIYAWGIYRIPDATPITSREVRTVTYPKTNLPNVTFFITSSFKAQGNYGADNPITIDVVIETIFNDVNSTEDLGNYYCCVTYTGAYYLDNPKEQGFLHLTYEGNGVFTAHGQLEWHEAGPTWSWLIPVSENVNWHVDRALIAQGPPTTMIGPIIDTQSWQNAQLQTRFELTAAGFSPLAAFEVLKKIFGGR